MITVISKFILSSWTTTIYLDIILTPNKNIKFSPKLIRFFSLYFRVHYIITAERVEVVG